MTLLTEHPSTVFAAQPKAFARLRRRNIEGFAETRYACSSPVRMGSRTPGFNALPEHLQPGDAVVINRSATVAGAWDAQSRLHGRVVLHAAAQLSRAAPATDGAAAFGRGLGDRGADRARRRWNSVLDAEPGEQFSARPP